MRDRWTRRDFLTTTTAAAVAHQLGGRLQASAAVPADPPRRKKALIGAPTREQLERFKAAGFDGMETNVWDVSPDVAAQHRATAEALGMRIHSVMRGWANFNSPDQAQASSDVDSVTTALRAAAGYGAEAILLVPCRLLAKVDIPRPEEFDIEFDAASGHVRRVVAGDNTKYQAYIAAQNEAVDMSRKALEQLIPVAERTGVIIALENVWSNFWVQPALFANFVKSFDSPWLQTYFDIGNHVKYARPEAWIQALGKTIVKVHVKDFQVDRAAPAGGKFVDIRDGEVAWPAVMKELDNIDYRGWMTIEGSGGLSLGQQSERLDLILAGS